MKIRDFLLASSLTVAFGCPGDDSGDDSNTSANASSTGQDVQTTGEQDSSGGNGSSSGGGDTSTGGGGESSSSGGGGESTTGDEPTGGMGAACESFCMEFFTTCGDSPDNDYGDPGGCVAACDGFSEPGFACRRMHVELAAGDPETHCVHASNGGGGVCMD